MFCNLHPVVCFKRKRKVTRELFKFGWVKYCPNPSTSYGLILNRACYKIAFKYSCDNYSTHQMSPNFFYQRRYVGLVWFPGVPSYSHFCWFSMVQPQEKPNWAVDVRHHRLNLAKVWMTLLSIRIELQINPLNDCKSNT